MFTPLELSWNVRISIYLRKKTNFILNFNPLTYKDDEWLAVCRSRYFV